MIALPLSTAASVPVLSWPVARPLEPIRQEKSMLGKVILWVSALAFISYGVMCLLDPTVPAEFAGLGFHR